MKKIFTIALLVSFFSGTNTYGQVCAPSASFNNAGKFILTFNSETDADYYEDTDGNGELNSCPLGGTCDQMTLYSASGTNTGTSDTWTVNNKTVIKDAGGPDLRSEASATSGSGDFTGSITFEFMASPSLTCTYTAGVLPVMYARFNAEKQAKTAVLSWTTGSEINNDYFVIERSSDSKDYTAIGEVKGAGNSADFVDYRFTDENPAEGMNYYRLRQIDFDGAENMSETKVVKMGNREATALTVYPSLTEGELTVDLVDYTEVKLNTQIVSGSGAVVRTFTLNGASKSIVNVTDLMPGLYFISVQSKNEVAIAKFVVK